MHKYKYTNTNINVDTDIDFEYRYKYERVHIATALSGCPLGLYLPLLGCYNTLPQQFNPKQLILLWDRRVSDMSDQLIPN